MEKLIEIACRGKAFVAIGTRETSEWSEGNPFVVIMADKETFGEYGFTEDEYERCMTLNVGEMTQADDYLGVYIMRVA